MKKTKEQTKITKKELSSIKEQIKKITRPIFEEVAKETKNNHVSVGGSVNYCSYYNPHNARYYFNFSKKNFSLKGSGGSVLKSINNGKEFSVADFCGCRIVVKKNLVEVTNKVGKDRLFKIHGSAEMRRSLVIDALVELERECVFALKEFIKVFGGSSDFIAVKVWIPDNKVLHDRLVDSVPSQTIFRNDVVKKVYNVDPKNVEFSDPVFASNYFRNSGLFDFAPDIALGLDSLNQEVSLLKRGVYKPVKESLLLKLSNAFLFRDWLQVSFFLNELLLLDGLLHSELKPLLQDVALQNGYKI